MSVAHVRGIELAYEVSGDGAPVVLLHGFPFNRTLWREQVEALRGRYRVVTVDLRGHGETPATSDAPATMEEMAEDIRALLDELQLTRVVLGGLSMGGYVALAFYRLFPARVRALILADTRPQADTDDARHAREETATRALDEGMQVIADTMLPKLLAPETHAERPEIVARVRTMILNTDTRGAASALRGMAVRRDQTELLREINCPVLVVVGSLDAITPPSDAELLQREIPDSRLEIIEGAGHVSNLERRAEFDSALEKFLRELEA
ncbi:MAG TPA: alpha/beta fold hydrolase [Pyrinomonadaceae bacterium]|nr:alpha/beta fold hydrolase [Pyrinomonadaceae bacterium]